MDMPGTSTTNDLAAAPTTGNFEIENVSHSFLATRKGDKSVDVWCRVTWKDTPVRMSDIVNYSKHINLRKTTAADLKFLNEYEPEEEVVPKFKCRFCSRGYTRRDRTIEHETRGCGARGSVRHNCEFFGCVPEDNCPGSMNITNYVEPPDLRTTNSGRKSGKGKKNKNK